MDDDHRSLLTFQIFHLRLVDVHVQALLFALSSNESQQLGIVVVGEVLARAASQVALVAPQMLGARRSELTLFVHVGRRMRLESFLGRLESAVVQTVLDAEKGFDVDQMELGVVVMFVVDAYAAK